MNRRKISARQFTKSLAFVASITLLSLSPATTPDPAEPTPALVPGTRVSVVVPAGFEAATQFPGFLHPDTGSSLMISEIPAGFSEMREGMTAARLAEQGVTLVSSEDVTVAGLDGLLLSASQAVNGIDYRKWLGIFGTDSETVMVVATYPEAVATELGEPLKQSVLSAKWDLEAEVDVFNGLTFRIKEPETLRIAKRISNMLLLTEDGQTGTVAPGNPLLIVASAVNDIEIADIETFSKNRLLQTAEVNAIADLAGQDVTAGGLPAYELTASAKDETSGFPLVIYQLVVPNGNSYYLMQGLVGTPIADKYLKEFRDVARSLTVVQ